MHIADKMTKDAIIRAICKTGIKPYPGMLLDSLAIMGDAMNCVGDRIVK